MGGNPWDHIGRLQREECEQEESAIKHNAIFFPKSLTRYYALLFNSLKRGKTFFAFQCRSLNNEALLNKQTEKSPEKLFITQAHCTKGKLLINHLSPLTHIYLRPQIKHITTSQQKYVSQWDLSRVQLNKSLQIPRASLEGEHISTVKHSQCKLHLQKVIWKHPWQEERSKGREQDEVTQVNPGGSTVTVVYESA